MKQLYFKDISGYVLYDQSLLNIFQLNNKKIYFGTIVGYSGDTYFHETEVNNVTVKRFILSDGILKPTNEEVTVDVNMIVDFGVCGPLCEESSLSILLMNLKHMESSLS